MPSFTNTLLAAAAVSAVAAKSGKVNVYYGQQGNNELATVCASGVDYVTLAFVNVSPENGGAAGYAGDNFANHCYAGYYDDSVLLHDCPPITDGWQTCKDNGVKLLLSIGGVFSSASNYTVSSDAHAVDFADFLWGAFGPYDPAYDGPRPFDVDGVHNSVDGFDFDIEHTFSDESVWNTLIATLRAHYATVTGDYIITAAPQCPFSDSSFAMATILAGSKFDALWVQFYNNPVCDGLGGGFNFDAWINYLTATPNADTPIFIGLPASEAAAGSGYLSPAAFADLVVQYRDSDHFGGVMLWDEYFGFGNTFETAAGVSDYVQLAIGLVDGTIPVVSSSSAVSSATSAASSSAANSSAIATSSVVSSSASLSSASASATSSLATSTFGFTNSSVSITSPVPTSTADASSGSTSGSGSGYTTSTVRSTVISTILSCAPTVTDCPYGKVTTSVIDLYTTVCPIAAGPTTTPSAPGAPGASVVPMTVSVVYSTSYKTITSCAPDVTNCPARVASHLVPVATTTIYAAVTAAVAGNVAAASSSAIFHGGHYNNATATLVTVVGGGAGGAGGAGSTGSSVTWTVSSSHVPTAPSTAVVTAGAGKVTVQAGVALLFAGVMMML